jgi:hypothetical protein
MSVPATRFGETFPLSYPVARGWIRTIDTLLKAGALPCSPADIRRHIFGHGDEGSADIPDALSAELRAEARPDSNRRHSDYDVVRQAFAMMV